MFSVSFPGIPMLIILDEKNELITLNGRPSISKDPEGKVGQLWVTVADWLEQVVHGSRLVRTSGSW